MCVCLSQKKRKGEGATAYGEYVDDDDTGTGSSEGQIKSNLPNVPLSSILPILNRMPTLRSSASLVVQGSLELDMGVIYEHIDVDSVLITPFYKF